jgi:predicted alpha/beta superfamily hydrolase
MPRFWIAAIFVCACLTGGVMSAQKKPRATAPEPTAGTTTITSFDKDHTVVGWLDIIPFESKIFHNTRMLRVLVPANYASPRNAHRSYPVLYMQDGQNLFDDATSNTGEWHVDETVEHLVGSFKIPPMFVVGIDYAGAERSSEYLPYPDPLNRKDNVTDEKGVHGKEYAKFLLTEVMPFIEKHYRVSRGAANTGLGGSSYGGDIALYTALEHPGIFGHVLVESPVLWIGDGQLLKDAEKAKLLPPKMYLAIGTEEKPYGDSQRNAEVVKQVQELEAILRKKGMGPTRLKVVVEENAVHNEGAWSRRLPEALLFLYGK